MSKRTAQADSWTSCRGMGIAWDSMAERTKQGRQDEANEGKGEGILQAERSCSETFSYILLGHTRNSGSGLKLR